jgi:hypothetical protein
LSGINWEFLGDHHLVVRENTVNPVAQIEQVAQIESHLPLADQQAHHPLILQVVMHFGQDFVRMIAEVG